MKQIIVILLFIISLVGCGKKVKPQQIANLKEQDTVAINLMLTNQILVEQTNDSLALYVAHCGKDFALHDNGFWYRYLKKNERDSLHDEEIVAVDYQVFLLDSTLCADVAKQVRVGKKEVPDALDDALRMSRHGEQLEIIAPWYNAYGQKGTNRIPAYTNVRFVLSIN